jgi:hypothetical protein
MTARAVQIGNDLATAEANADLERIKANGSLATVTTIYAALSGCSGGSARCVSHRNANRRDHDRRFSFDADRRAVAKLFGMTAGQVTTLRNSKLTPAANAATTIRAATGA